MPQAPHLVRRGIDKLDNWDYDGDDNDNSRQVMNHEHDDDISNDDDTINDGDMLRYVIT